MPVSRPKVRAANEPLSGRVAADAAHWRFDVVAIGCSAGGLNSLVRVLSTLEPEFSCAVLVVQHMSPQKESLLPGLLGRSSAVRVKQAEHDEPLLAGYAYIGPPNEHLLAGPGKIQLAHTKLVRFSRPSVDLLFESVAECYGPRCIGVILSGALQDGAEGIRAIKEAGGTTIVEAPEHAEFGSMPKAAVATGCVDHILPLDEIGATLCQLCAPAPR